MSNDTNTVILVGTIDAKSDRHELEPGPYVRLHTAHDGEPSYHRVILPETVDVDDLYVGQRLYIEGRITYGTIRVMDAELPTTEIVARELIAIGFKDGKMQGVTLEPR